MTTSGLRSVDITEKPVQNFGRWYRADLNNQAHVRELLDQAEEWLKAPCLHLLGEQAAASPDRPASGGNWWTTTRVGPPCGVS